MAVKVVCDFCDKPLEFEDGRYVVYHTKLLNTRESYPHLCKSCARKLDDIFADLEIVRKMNTIEKMEEINQARRERLGTKG